MEIILSAAISLDGYLDDASPARLRLSSPEDWAAVLELRRQCDAILVGAETVRRDDPGLKEVPLRVVLSRSGRIPAGARIFAGGEVLMLAGRDFDGCEVAGELEKRGVRRLMVEGGGEVLKMFLDQGFVDRLRLAVAPVFVGGGTRFPSVAGAEDMVFERVEMLGQTTVMHLRGGFLRRAIELSRCSPPSPAAYRVGAVVVTSGGLIFEGYTHETGPRNHAEEEAIAKAVAAGEGLRGATIYVSMEPCSTRASKPVSCSESIIRHGFKKVVYALAEPPLLAACTGAQNLVEAGVEVVHAAHLAPLVRKINAHLLGE